MLKFFANWIHTLFGPREKLELSYSKLRAYLDCPYRYSLRYIERWHSPPTPNSSLGNSIHKALELYHSQNGRTLDELMQAYQDGWDHEGYEDSSQTMEFFQRGEKILAEYHEKDKNRKSKILFSEKKFKIDVSFCWIRGIIDRIDRLPDGSIEIIDYKTHKAMWTKKAISQDMQLTVYNLACKKELQEEPKLLSFYFLSKGRKISTTRTKTDEKKLLLLLKKTCRQISKGNFKPNTKFCYRCDFTGRCTYAKKKN